jgi:ankyrin repeat protein
LLESDPSRNLYQTDHPMHVLNKPLWKDQTPLYIACKNGNIDCVRLLLEKGAKAIIKSKIGEDDYESNLSVSVRWSKLEVIKLLLSEEFQVEWSKDDFKVAYKNVNKKKGEVYHEMRAYSKR